jgi:hypothetical protein
MRSGGAFGQMTGGFDPIFDQRLEVLPGRLPSVCLPSVCLPSARLVG